MAEREPLLHRSETVESESESLSNPRGGIFTEDTAPELQDLKTAALLKAQGHNAEMERSFSPLAALGLGFRYPAHQIGTSPRLNHYC